MALTPTIETNEFLKSEIEITTYPGKTYKMDLVKGRIRGNVDELAAMPQTIYCILNTERNTYLAYSDGYGVELEDLFGMPISYVLPELERRIRDALIWDSRIEEVDGFSFEVNQSVVHVTFTVHTIYGNLEMEKVVNI
jgi:hypothetical protein